MESIADRLAKVYNGGCSYAFCAKEALKAIDSLGITGIVCENDIQRGICRRFGRAGEVFPIDGGSAVAVLRLYQLYFHGIARVFGERPDASRLTEMLMRFPYSFGALEIAAEANLKNRRAKESLINETAIRAAFIHSESHRRICMEATPVCRLDFRCAADELKEFYGDGTDEALMLCYDNDPKQKRYSPLRLDDLAWTETCFL